MVGIPSAALAALVVALALYQARVHRKLCARLPAQCPEGDR